MGGLIESSRKDSRLNTGAIFCKPLAWNLSDNPTYIDGKQVQSFN